MLDDRSFAPESRLPAGARQARLMEMLTRNGFLSVAEAAERMGVSSMTIRRDLEILEARGVLTRTHGGAVAIQGRRLEVFDAVEPVFDQRRRRQAGAKSKIAAAAAGLIGPNETVALDVGTSVLALAKELVGRPDLKFLTNNLPAAMTLSGGPSPVYLLGGQLRSENASTVGPQAEAMLDTLWFDQLFLGVSAIGPDGAIYSVDSAEANLNRCMLARAGQRFLLADSSKFGTMATYRVAPLTQARIVTDAGLSPKWRGNLADMGVEVTVAPAV